VSGRPFSTKPRGTSPPIAHEQINDSQVDGTMQAALVSMAATCTARAA
jgi:hypothetical protein